MLSNAVLLEEAEFANREYAPFANDLDINPTMFRKYATPAELWDWRQLAAVLLGDVADKDLLDYGCGMGEESIYLAKLGARVTAIDISNVGVGIARRRAEHNGLSIVAMQRDCEHTGLPDASFDRVHGMGILHHVGIEPALAEIWRLLRPGGIGVFLEPVGDQWMIEAVKRFMIDHGRFMGFEQVTEHEHNLTWREIDHATKRFSRALAYPYHVLYRIKRLFPVALYDRVRRFDHALLAIAPRLRRVAGAVVIQVVR